MGNKKEEASAARDFAMARLAACRGSLAQATTDLDELCLLMVMPDEDKRGEKRAELLEGVDELIGAAATSIQLAQSAWSDVDPKEAEPEPEDDEDDPDDEDDDEDD